MKQIIAIFLLLALNLMPTLVKAGAVEQAVQKIESQWAHIHYNVAKEQQEAAYQQLLAEVKALNLQHPDQAELIIQQAIIIASNADNIQARHATSRNSGTPVTLIRSPTQRMGDALNALRP